MMKSQREFTFTDQNFQNLRRIVREHTGISLTEAKRELVYSRLSRRLRKLNIKGFDEYTELLKTDDQGELTEFTNAITTNLTSFFREVHHFDYLAKTILPGMLERQRHSARLRVWSAGCSTGEEPYSIAIILSEVLPRIQEWDVRILATDLDSNVVAHAADGVYAQERIKGLSQQRMRRWFRKGKGANEGKVRVVPELREIVSFRQLNLMHPWPMNGPFDIIFCRNVVIYFDKDTQRVLFDRFAELVDEQGHLFVGHSESLFNVTDRFRLIGKTIYRRAA
ncbi:MAG: protein-glutamate O-methyltransferase [Gammaproteobacteria bacterium]|nr:protein-glutamate O-methyltransferase [Gammaproteobacteria bacterium]